MNVPRLQDSTEAAVEGEINNTSPCPLDVEMCGTGQPSLPSFAPSQPHAKVSRGGGGALAILSTLTHIPMPTGGPSTEQHPPTTHNESVNESLAGGMSHSNHQQDEDARDNGTSANHTWDSAPYPSTVPFFGEQHAMLVNMLRNFANMRNKRWAESDASNNTNATELDHTEEQATAAWSQSQLSLVFRNPIIEQEFLLSVHGHRSQIYITTAYGIVAIVSETIRLSPAVKDMPFLAALLVIGALGFVILFLGTIKLTQQLAAHDSHITPLPRSALRFNAFAQEMLILLLVVFFGVFMTVSTFSLGTCPWVTSPLGKLLYCHDAFGSDSFFLLLYSTPSALLPIRWKTAVVGFIFNTACLVGVMLSLPNQGLVQPLQSGLGNNAEPSSAFVVLDMSLVSAKVIFYTVFGAYVILSVRLNERPLRTQFQYVTLLNSVQEEAQRLHATLAKQFEATIPAHIARRLLDGERIRDYVPCAGIMMFAVPQFAAYSSSHSSSEVVDILNQIFCVLDGLLAEYPLITKMQTLGDLYILVSGLSWTVQRNNSTKHVEEEDTLERDNATVIYRYATTAKRLAAEVTSFIMVLDIQPILCTVLGTTKSYVALGMDKTAQTIRENPDATGLIVTPAFSAILSRNARETYDISTARIAIRRHTKEPDETNELLMLSTCGADLSSTAHCMIISTFNDDTIEKKYRRFVVTNRREHDREFSAFALAFLLSAFLGVEFWLVWKPSNSLSAFVEYRACLACIAATGALSLAACIATSKLRHGYRNANRIAFTVYLVFFHAALYLFPHPSSTVNNTVLWTLALNIVSTRRIDFFSTLVHTLIDTLVINVPLWVLFFLNTQAAHQESTLEYLHSSIPSWGSSSRFSTTALLEPLPRNDFISLIVQSVYLNLTVVPSVNLVIRILHDRHLRQSFVNEFSLRQMTRRLIRERADLEAFTRSIIPTFVVDRFEKFARLHAGQSALGNDNSSPTIDPWQGAWFATPVEEVPVMVIHIQAAVEQDWSSRGGQVETLINWFEHCHNMIDQTIDAFKSVVCKAKSAGDVIILIGSEVDPEPIRAQNLARCALSLLQRFRGQKNAPKVVLNHGLAVGAVIGSDRLSFEIFGEVISTALELLHAMPASGIIATSRFERCFSQASVFRLEQQQQVSSSSGNSAYDGERCSFGEMQIWKVRGSAAVGIFYLVQKEDGPVMPSLPQTPLKTD